MASYSGLAAAASTMNIVLNAGLGWRLDKTNRHAIQEREQLSKSLERALEVGNRLAAHLGDSKTALIDQITALQLQKAELEQKNAEMVLQSANYKKLEAEYNTTQARLQQVMAEKQQILELQQNQDLPVFTFKVPVQEVAVAEKAAKGDFILTFKKVRTHPQSSLDLNFATYRPSVRGIVGEMNPFTLITKGVETSTDHLTHTIRVEWTGPLKLRTSIAMLIVSSSYTERWGYDVRLNDVPVRHITSGAEIFVPIRFVEEQQETPEEASVE